MMNPKMLLFVIFLIVSSTLMIAAEDDPNPYLKADDTWISFSGTVVETRPDNFVVDFGEGIVTVDMLGWNWYDEGKEFLEGDKVTVYGIVDDDMFETTTIEATSVYVENRGTYYYANYVEGEIMDEDYDFDFWVEYGPVDIAKTVVRGTVTSIDGRDFTIDTGVRKVTIDTSAMEYNPLDDMGFQQVDVGDYVSASGMMDQDFWDNAELNADTVITMEDDL